MNNNAGFTKVQPKATSGRGVRATGPDGKYGDGSVKVSRYAQKYASIIDMHYLDEDGTSDYQSGSLSGYSGVGSNTTKIPVTQSRGGVGTEYTKNPYGNINIGFIDDNESIHVDVGILQDRVSAINQNKLKHAQSRKKYLEGLKDENINLSAAQQEALDRIDSELQVATEATGESVSTDIETGEAILQEPPIQHAVAATVATAPAPVAQPVPAPVVIPKAVETAITPSAISISNERKFKVVIDGGTMFGKFRGKYVHVENNGELLVLVYDLEDQVFSPPSTEEPFIVSVNDDHYRVVTGTDFELEVQGLGYQIFFLYK